jgi:hypothetical protein
MNRNRCVDLLRVRAIGGVVHGRWLLVSITYTCGQLSGVDAIGYISQAPRVTWAFEVSPAFFLVAALLAGVLVAGVGEAGWLAALQLWFLPVYLLAAMTPGAAGGSPQVGPSGAPVMAAAAALVNVGVTGAPMQAVGPGAALAQSGSCGRRVVPIGGQRPGAARQHCGEERADRRAGRCAGW